LKLEDIEDELAPANEEEAKTMTINSNYQESFRLEMEEKKAARHGKGGN
jgi:hypothetical protein